VQKTALLLGGSGLTGGHCLEYLLNDARYNQVMALVRRPLPVEHPKLVQHQVDFHHLDDCLAGMQINDVFCCLGTTIKKAGSQKAFYEVDFVYPAEIAQLSLASGAEQFLLISALGANPRSTIFYNRVKGEVEEAIARYGFKGFYIFRPSLLLGKRRESRPVEKFGETLFHWLSFIFKGVLQTYKPIASRAVAFAMVAVAKEQPLGKRIFESRRIHAIYDQR
jgi:uncharacterized protein YbjT (DUF2867 family)